MLPIDIEKSLFLIKREPSDFVRVRKETLQQFLC